MSLKRQVRAKVCPYTLKVSSALKANYVELHLCAIDGQRRLQMVVNRRCNSCTICLLYAVSHVTMLFSCLARILGSVVL